MSIGSSSSTPQSISGDGLLSFFFCELLCGKRGTLAPPAPTCPFPIFRAGRVDEREPKVCPWPWPQVAFCCLALLSSFAFPLPLDCEPEEGRPERVLPDPANDGGDCTRYEMSRFRGNLEREDVPEEQYSHLALVVVGRNRGY